MHAYHYLKLRFHMEGKPFGLTQDFIERVVESGQKNVLGVEVDQTCHVINDENHQEFFDLARNLAVPVEGEMLPAKLVTYGLAGDPPKNDKRHSRFESERRRTGFDQTEIWSLYTAISKFILPRLKVYYDCFANIQSDEFATAVKKMIKAFEKIVVDDPVDKRDPELKEGLDLFREYFFGLWC